MQKRSLENKGINCNTLEKPTAGLSKKRKKKRQGISSRTVERTSM